MWTGSKQTSTMGTAQHGTTNYWDGRWDVCVYGSIILRWNVYQHAHGLLGPEVLLHYVDLTSC